MAAKLTFYGGVEEIGGNKILLQTEDGSVLLDFGRRMGFYQNYFSEFLQVRSKNALRDMLRLGVLPKIDGIYTPHLLDMTLLFENAQVREKVPFGGGVGLLENHRCLLLVILDARRLMGCLFRMLTLIISRTSAFLIPVFRFIVRRRPRFWRRL